MSHEYGKMKVVVAVCAAAALVVVVVLVLVLAGVRVCYTSCILSHPRPFQHSPLATCRLPSSTTFDCVPHPSALLCIR